MLLLGTLAWLILTAIHGDLPATGQAAMEYINPTVWRPVHILTIVSIMVVAGGFALLVRTFTDPVAAALGRVGSVFLIVAAAVLGIDFAIDGFVLPALVEHWEATTDPSARATYVERADFVLTIMGGTALSYQTLFGTAVGTLAGATLVSGEYPRWLCWVGLAGGVFWGAMGIVIFSQVPGAQFSMVFLAIVPVVAWLLGIGWLSWQRGRAASRRHAASGSEEKERRKEDSG